MRLVAIYLEEHEFLIDEPQTINFGGRYLYEFKKNKGTIYLLRKINENFIENFFDKGKWESKINNVSAIVGQNGAGKTTILNIIRSIFVEHVYSMPYSKAIFVVESENNISPLILSSDFAENIKYRYTSEEVINNKLDKIEIEVPLIKYEDFQTIYYSPHFNYSYNPNFDEVDNFDISFDKILEEDLQDLDNKNPNANGWMYQPHQELLFKNSTRQLQFLSSDLVLKNKIFNDFFDFPNHGQAILKFRGHKIEKDWNTPYAFRPILSTILKKNESEVDGWVNVRKFGKDGNVSNQLEINKYLLKRFIIKDIITVLQRQMEKRNDFLSEGKMNDDANEDIKDLDALNSFYYFIQNAKIYSKNVFDHNVVNLLINKLYECIDKTKEVEKIANDHLEVSGADAIEILKYQNQFVQNVMHYYKSFYKEKILEKSDNVDGFINYMPSRKKLSSGQNALLNFFSRLYSFIETKISENSKYFKDKEHYLLLLDETDLGFHPLWKKKFINSILSTLPYFFDSLKIKPTIQIIITTHDSLTLSDIPNNNIVYVQTDFKNGKANVLKYNDPARPSKSFGANITDLLADSFFINNGLMGDFAKEKIQNVINWLNQEIPNLKEKDVNERTIEMIDEPILRRKLSEMYSNKFNENLELEIIESEIRLLENRRNILKNKR